MKTTLTLALAALATLAAGAASAQTAGPADPGPVIPGVCVYHNERVISQSTAGQALNSGMQRLFEEVRGELQPYAASIETEAQALAQGQASIPAAEMQQRRQQLQQRLQEAQQLEQQRDAELRYTRAVQLQAIAQAVDPIIVTVYQERGCGLLLDRESVYVMNPAMDVSDVVIQRLNGALPTLSFSRLAVPAELQGQ